MTRWLSACGLTTCPKNRSSGIWTSGATAACRTAGFGLGLERTVAWICGTEHIREVIPFPRMLYRVYP